MPSGEQWYLENNDVLKTMTSREQGLLENGLAKLGFSQVTYALQTFHAMRLLNTITTTPV